MRVLYVLEQPLRRVEPFVRREILEAARQGLEIEVLSPCSGTREAGEASRPEACYIAETAGESARPRSLRPPGAAEALAMALSLSPAGTLRALRHARGSGWGLGSGFRQAVALGSEARKFGANVIHAHFAARACEDAMLASWISEVPFTFTAHGYDVHFEPPPDYPARAAAAGAVVTVSEWNARALSESRGVPRGKIHVIPCGVDTRRFAPAPDEPDGGAREGLVVSVIRLHRDKGPDILLDAAAELLASGVDFRMEILGDGPERSVLQARLDGPLGSRVRLLGEATEEEVLAALRRASVFALPSRTESLGVALMEAMSCERAVVAADVGGVPEVLDGGRCGLLVPPGDAGPLAGAIRDLLRDPARRRTLGKAARERVIQRFRLEDSVAALRALWSGAAWAVDR